MVCNNEEVVFFCFRDFSEDFFYGIWVFDCFCFFYFYQVELFGYFGVFCQRFVNEDGLFVYFVGYLDKFLEMGYMVGKGGCYEIFFVYIFVEEEVF